jgi:hypothetical protein
MLTIVNHARASYGQHPGSWRRNTPMHLAYSVKAFPGMRVLDLCARSPSTGFCRETKSARETEP